MRGGKQHHNLILLNYFRGNAGNGEGMLVSGLVPAMLLIPIIVSTTRD